MKKLIGLTMLLLINLSGFAADRVVVVYELSFFEKSFDIRASEVKKDKFDVYIEVGTESIYRTAMISVPNTKLDELKTSLKEMRDKFEEWSQVAKDNDVEKLTKPMEVKFPRIDIYWYTSKWNFSRNNSVQPIFFILDGVHLATIVKKAISMSNKYINETIYLAFKTTE